VSLQKSMSGYVGGFKWGHIGRVKVINVRIEIR
jgi:hypothetical protein